MSRENNIPVYMKIAIDMASRISRYEFKKDQKISGRSTLAGEYNVSPETIRKAVRLLTTMNIVDVQYGKGIYISSIERAEEFVKQYRSRQNISELKTKLNRLMRERFEIEEQMTETMNSIIDSSSRFTHLDKIVIYEEVIPENSCVCGMAIGKLDIWQNTGATIVGIKQEEDITISPSPAHILKCGESVLFVCDHNDHIKFHKYLYNE